nr:hypothetical protein [Tanacetum cinerariifolium]
MITRSHVGTFKPNHRFHGHTSHISPLPKSPSIALSDPYWRDAMYDEYNALIKNGIGIFVLKPPNVNVVWSMWLFRHKYHVDGSLSMYKARLVANGRNQQYEVDCSDTFSPVVKLATIRTPPGFVDSRFPHHVCRLQQSLYGLKQAPHAWFQRFTGYALRVGFTLSRSLLQRIISSLHKEFDMTYLGALNSFLGISITRDARCMFLSQKKYVVELLEHAHMSNCNSTRTPIDTESKHGSDGDSVSDSTLYHSLAGGLRCLTFTRPDISYAVQRICLHMHDPQEPHLASLKQVRVLHVPSRYRDADIFTKGLPSALFEEFRIMKMEPDIENMTFNEYLEYEAVKKAIMG